MFTGARSCRGAKESEMVPFDMGSAKMQMVHAAYNMDIQTVIRLGEQKKIIKKRCGHAFAFALAGGFCAVVFRLPTWGLFRVLRLNVEK